MNYKCCDGSIVRFLLSAPVRLTVFLVLCKYFDQSVYSHRVKEEREREREREREERERGRGSTDKKLTVVFIFFSSNWGHKCCCI